MAAGGTGIHAALLCQALMIFETLILGEFFCISLHFVCDYFSIVVCKKKYSVF